jgi:23S rRNA (pseudouridine1915-N3)-methyltransferase
LKNYSDLELSLSDLTFPHSLALLILVEQIYRLSMIKKGTSYDK